MVEAATYYHRGNHICTAQTTINVGELRIFLFVVQLGILQFEEKFHRFCAKTCTHFQQQFQRCLLS
jgi:hypothetical protein